MNEPTREDAYRIADALGVTGEEREWATEEALYWYAADYHGGQWSGLYSILSTSPFKPGPLHNGPEPDTYAEMIYAALVEEFNT